MRNILSFHKKIERKPGSNTLLYWPLTENANDYSGNGNNGTAYSSVSFSSNGAYFSGSNNTTNFIDFPSSFYPGTSFTISLRIKKGENNKELRMFSDWGPSYRRILWALTSSGYTNLLFGNGSTSQSEWSNIQAYSANTWYNYVLVKDGANATIYRDGALVGTHTFSYNSSPGGLAIGEYGIGNIRTSSSSSSMGTGYIKDYIIENKLWTAEEVLDYYSQTKSAYIEEGWRPGSNTLAYFPMQGDGLDKIGNYTISNTGTQQTLGREITATSNISPNVTGAKTILAWVKINSASARASIMRCVCYNFNFTIKDNDITTYPAFFLWRNSTLYNSGSNVVSTGNRYLIALVRDTNLIGYINGNAYPLSYTGSVDIAPDESYILTIPSGSASVIMSEVIIEDRTWTQQEIQDYYNQTKSNYGL